jgi:hypothetical protein
MTSRYGAKIKPVTTFKDYKQQLTAHEIIVNNYKSNFEEGKTKFLDTILLARRS